MRSVDKIVEGFRREAQQDYVGLWQVTGTVMHNFKLSEASKIREMTLTIVRQLLDSGLCAVDLAPGGRCTPWSDQEPESVVRRIEAEWNALGRDPDIGDIVWFNLPPRTSRPS